MCCNNNNNNNNDSNDDDDDDDDYDDDDDDKCISRAPFHVKYALLRWTGTNAKIQNTLIYNT